VEAQLMARGAQASPAVHVDKTCLYNQPIAIRPTANLVPLMLGIVSIARYQAAWCKQPQALHAASKMERSDERMPIWQASRFQLLP
jgi:hypothetical protein